MTKYEGYENLVELNQSGVYALVQVHTGDMFISYSNNILSAVTRHLMSAKEGINSNPHLNEQYKNLHLYIIEFCDSNNLKYRYTYWCNNLKPKYNLVPPPQYRIRTRVDSNFLIWVELINKHRDVLVLGIFNSNKEATDFCNIVNSLDPIRPIYATNTLTRDYIRDE